MSDIRIGVLEFSDRPFPLDYVPPVGYGVDWSPDSYDNVESAAAGLRDAITKVAVARGDDPDQVGLVKVDVQMQDGYWQWDWAVYWDNGLPDWPMEFSEAAGISVGIGDKNYTLAPLGINSLQFCPHLENQLRAR